jgi:hypothetical protein
MHLRGEPGVLTPRPTAENAIDLADLLPVRDYRGAFWIVLRQFILQGGYEFGVR